MTNVLGVVSIFLYLFLVLLLARLALEWIQVFARQWQPRGPVLVIAETTYTATDPPLKAVRKVLKPVRIGSIQLDLAFLVLLLGVYLLLNVIRSVH
ncbi:YggT family protein [Dermatophilaceae bacterium Sec6.4]|nr:YggT family protein [Actinomycetota bacterium]